MHVLISRAAGESGNGVRSAAKRNASHARNIRLPSPVERSSWEAGREYKISLDVHNKVRMGSAFPAEAGAS